MVFNSLPDLKPQALPLRSRTPASINRAEPRARAIINSGGIGRSCRRRARSGIVSVSMPALFGGLFVLNHAIGLFQEHNFFGRRLAFRRDAGGGS